MASLPRIYIDSCCVLEAALAKTTPERETDVVFIRKILQAAEAKDIIVQTSVLTVAECYQIPGLSNEEAVELFSAVLTSGHCVRVINPTVFTGERARDLFVKHNIKLKGPDALHIASAIEKNCTEFITFDGKRANSPLKNAKALEPLGLRVIRPSQTKNLPQSYRQEKLLDEGPGLFESGARAAIKRRPASGRPPATVN